MGRKRHALGEAGSEATVYQSAGHPLLMALFEGDVEGVRKLLQAEDCDVEVADHLGWRPLHRAAFGGFDEVVGLLLERRADATAVDTEGMQPLHVAAAGGHYECCKRLIAARADPAAPDALMGMTPQLYAMAKDDLAGRMLQELVGAPDLQLFAALDNPLQMAQQIASADSEERKLDLEAYWAAYGDGAEAAPPLCQACPSPAALDGATGGPSAAGLPEACPQEAPAAPGDDLD